MLGQDVAYDRLPYFYTDQYDLGMEYSGYVAARRLRRASSSAATSPRREFIAFWLDDGRVLAGMNVNVWDVTDDVQALIRAGAPVDRASSPTRRPAGPGRPAHGPALTDGHVLTRARRRGGAGVRPGRRAIGSAVSSPSSDSSRHSHALKATGSLSAGRAAKWTGDLRNSSRSGAASSSRGCG